MAEYTLIYEANGGVGEPPASEQYEEGAEVNLPAEVELTKEDFIFGGWSELEDGDPVEEPYLMPGEETTLYAVWAEDEGEGNGEENGEGGDNGGLVPGYIITFNGNTGTGDGPEPINAPEDAKVKLPGAGGLVKENYYFGGWSATADGESLGDIFTMPGKNVTLYAIWLDEEDYVDAQRSELERIMKVCLVQVGARGEDYLVGMYVMQVTCDALIRSFKTGKPVKIEYEGYTF